MRVPPIPPNEPARLELLRSLGILDTRPEAIADSIVTAAAAIANMPTAAISLVDADRQWFKAALGLGASETPRDVSFCAHAMLQDDPLIIPDALADARFCDNPLVTGSPHIRFYAGFRLSLEGLPLGALCLIDSLPRRLDASQVARLRDLAMLTSDWIAQRSPRATESPA